MQEQLVIRQRRRLFAAGRQGSQSTSCQLHPPISDPDITRLLCRSGQRYVRQDCEKGEEIAMEATAPHLSQRSRTVVIGGFSLGIALLVVLTLIVIGLLLRRGWPLKKRKRGGPGQQRDAERPPKSLLMRHRRRRRLRRLLRLPQNRVHFDEHVDVAELHSAAELTSDHSSSSAVADGKAGGKEHFTRRNSPWFPSMMSHDSHDE